MQASKLRAAQSQGARLPTLEADGRTAVLNAPEGVARWKANNDYDVDGPIIFYPGIKIGLRRRSGPPVNEGAGHANKKLPLYHDADAGSGDKRWR
jgi:hypothetical protein